MMLLGLSGKALSGKDTVADYILDNNGWTRKVGFASNLKTACIEIFDLTEYHVHTQEGKSSYLSKPVIIDVYHLNALIGWMRKTHDISLEDKDYSSLLGKVLLTPRDILQFVGTEVMRYYISNYHLEVVFKQMLQDEKVIITDVRFPNEAEAVLNSSGYLFRIDRDYELRSKHGIVIDSSHPSEVALDDWDKWSVRINNNTESLNRLYSDIDGILHYLEEGYV